MLHWFVVDDTESRKYLIIRLSNYRFNLPIDRITSIPYIDSLNLSSPLVRHNRNCQNEWTTYIKDFPTFLDSGSGR